MLGLLLFCTASSCLLADYPVASHRSLADPSTLVTRDRVYVYCSNDDENPTGENGTKPGYAIPDVVCLSSSDMKNWTDHGSVFRAETGTTWAKKTWAPAAAERDGRYFLYFGNGGSNIGVVTSLSPTGPFIDPLGRDLINHRTPGVQPAENMWLFDPGVFIDDDGQAYLYFGGNGDDNVRVVKLSRDMIHLDGEVIKLSAPHFFEASWVFKREGVYYFAYSTNPKGGLRIDYMTSRSPLSGFTYQGVVAGQPPLNNNNNHAAEFLFKGTWYHVYHNRVVAKQAGIPAEFRRNLAIETFGFNADGSIRQVDYTVDGVPQVGRLNPYERVEGETFAEQSGVETEPCRAGGMNLTSLDSGDWILLKGVDFGAKGASQFRAWVASAGQGGTLELYIDGPQPVLIGSCKVPDTGGWQSWQAVSCEISGAVGVQNLRLKFVGDTRPLMNLDWWVFEARSPR